MLPVRDSERYKRWLPINNSKIGEDAGIEMIKGKTICSLHFKLEDYDRNLFGMMRHALKQIAVPSVFTVARSQMTNRPALLMHLLQNALTYR